MGGPMNLGFAHLQVKVISLVFVVLVWRPFLWSQVRTSSYLVHADLVAALRVAEMVYMAPSLMYSERLACCQFFMVSKRDEV
jgi:hypothetical protein